MRRLLWYGNSSGSDRNPNSSDNPVCLSVQSYGTYCQQWKTLSTSSSREAAFSEDCKSISTSTAAVTTLSPAKRFLVCKLWIKQEFGKQTLFIEPRLTLSPWPAPAHQIIYPKGRSESNSNAFIRPVVLVLFARKVSTEEYKIIMKKFCRLMSLCLIDSPLFCVFIVRGRSDH
jgi:hypothetical protein